MDNTTLQKMSNIFGECFLSGERAIEKEELTFYENYADSFTKHLLSKAYHTFTEGEFDDDTAEMILNAIYRAASLSAVMSFHNYSQFVSLTEQLEEGE